MAFKDLTGQKFNRLTVIKRVENDWQGNAKFLCRCECGKQVIVLGYCLRNKNTQSRGCLGREKRIEANTIHNLSKHRLHIIWDCMKARCGNKNNPNYKYYGGRGIKVCEEWKNDFMNFYNWAITNKYEKSLTIDRINNNGNYEPNNCRWVTMKEQNKNKRQRKKGA